MARGGIIGRLRVGVLVAWAAMAAAYVAADESKAGGIQSAKRDYEALQAVNADAKSPTGAPPKSALPVLDAAPRSPDEPALPRPLPKNALTEKRARSGKSATWLLDAMREKKAGAADESDSRAIGLRDEDELPESEGEDLLANAAELERDATAAEAQKRRSIEERQRTPEPVNPLDRYMASWMTPKDFELLQGSSERSSPNPSGLSGSVLPRGAANHAGSFPNLGAETTMRDIAVRDQPSFFSSPPNPYLLETPAALSAPLLSSPFSTPATAPTSAAPASPAPVRSPAAEPSPSRTPLSETLRGVHDAKYFKQLKRF